jgi:hypothetical protein
MNRSLFLNDHRIGSSVTKTLVFGAEYENPVDGAQCSEYHVANE